MGFFVKNNPVVNGRGRLLMNGEWICIYVSVGYLILHYNTYKLV